MRRHVLLVLVLLSLAAPLHAQRVVTVFPQFVSGGGWSSDIFINNQSPAAATLDVSFYGDAGDALTVDSNLGIGSSFVINLGAGNTNVVRVSAAGSLKAGYVLLGFTAGSSIRASEVFRNQQNGIVSATVGVAEQFPETTYSFPVEVDTKRGINTGLAIANGAFVAAGSQPQSCVVSLIRSDGTLGGMAKLDLAAGAHIARYLNEGDLFPGLDGFVGSVSIFAPNGAGVLALRQEQAIFGSVSVDSGPLVSPFLLSSQPLSEVEPNNSRTAAQRITAPIVMAGVISVAGDADYYQFTGTQGDVVTAVMSTVGLTSGIDALVILANADGTIIAENDESGILYSSDAFLQAVLPSTGTYYLVVTDYFGRGGSNGGYRLHVQSSPPVFPAP